MARKGRYRGEGSRGTYAFEGVEDRKIRDTKTGRTGTVSINQSGNYDGKQTDRRVGEKIRQGKVRWDK